MRAATGEPSGGESPMMKSNQLQFWYCPTTWVSWTNKVGNIKKFLISDDGNF